jgi:RimJ/RimL family protein N-acetyltransferase
MTNPFIIGKKVILRTLCAKDAEGNYVSWFNDAETCRHNSHHLFPYYKGDAIKYIENVNRTKKDLVLAIIDKKRKTHIGNVSLQKIDYVGRNAEFAIILGEAKYRGKGFAKEAATLILEHGFSALNLHRIYCGTSDDNIPMKNMALSLGMKEEGRRVEAMYKDGSFKDVVEYGILRKNFIKSRGKA